MSLNLARPCCDQDLTQYRHKVVRDLVWSLFSPDLVSPDWPGTANLEEDWLCRMLLDLLPALSELDSDPTPLQATLAERRSGRLGESFELLIRHALSLHPDIELLAHNLVISHQGRTLGEIDLLLRDVLAARTLALETSVKFYLGPRDARTDPALWIGPNPQDRLSTRLQRLEHQLALCTHPATRELLAGRGIHDCTARALVRGRLFHYLPHWEDAAPPLGANPHHLRGWWAEHGHFRDWMPTDAHWVILDRSDWLAPLSRNDVVEPLDSSALRGLLGSRLFSRPVCLARIAAGEEISRGFVVPNSWMNNIENQSVVKNNESLT